MPASLYDAILVKGTMRPRLNKNFVSPENVPQVVMDILTTDNIVDENGMIVVDQKLTASSEPTDENKEELEKEGIKLERVDQSTPDETEQKPQEQVAPPAPSESAPAPVTIDDSANQNETPEGDQNATSTSNEITTKDTPAPVAQTAPTQPEQPAPAPASQAPEAQAPTRAKRVVERAEPVETFRSKVPQSQQGMGFPRKNGKTVDIFDLKTPHTHVKLVAGVTVPLSAESFKTKGDLAITKRLAELGIETLNFDVEERQQNFAGAADPSILLEDDEIDEDIQLDR